MQNFLFNNVSKLKGVGTTTKKILKRKKIEKVSDLLWNLPQGFTDRTNIKKLNELEIGKVTTIKVKVSKYNFPRIRNLPSKVICEDEESKIDIVFFNSREGYIRKILPINSFVIISGKVSSTTQNTMHHINITSTGDTTEFGKMHVRGTGPAASNNVRGIFGGWNGNARVGMRAITIASLGVSSEFGNLTVNRSGTGEGNSSSQTRAIFMGGAVSPTFYNIIDYVNMQTLGDAVDFGDLTGTDIVGNRKVAYGSAISDCHGGLGGY